MARNLSGDRGIGSRQACIAEYVPKQDDEIRGRHLFRANRIIQALNNFGG
jgi:hypothetical protein